MEPGPLQFVLLSSGVALVLEGAVPACAPAVWLGIARAGFAVETRARAAMSWGGMVAGLALMWLAVLLGGVRWPGEVPLVPAAFTGVGIVLIGEGLFLRWSLAREERLREMLWAASASRVRLAGTAVLASGLLLLIAGWSAP